MTQTIHTATDDTFSPVRALNSLTSAQASQIIAGLSSLADTWDIVHHEGCDGQLSLLLAHIGHDDTTLVVDRDHDGIHISLMLGDHIHASKHRYQTTSDIIAAINVFHTRKFFERLRANLENITDNIERKKSIILEFEILIEIDKLNSVINKMYGDEYNIRPPMNHWAIKY